MKIKFLLWAFASWNFFSWLNLVVVSSWVHSLCKSNSVVSKVEFCVEWSNENISQNPQWAERGRYVNSGESTKTNILTTLGYLHQIKVGFAHVIKTTNQIHAIVLLCNGVFDWLLETCYCLCHNVILEWQ